MKTHLFGINNNYLDKINNILSKINNGVSFKGMHSTSHEMLETTMRASYAKI